MIPFLLVLGNRLQRTQLKQLSATRDTTREWLSFRLVGLQSITVLIVLLLWTCIGCWFSIYSALIGSIAALVPSFCFAKLFFKTTSAKKANKIVRNFYIGELIKLVMSSVLLGLIITLIPIKLLPFLTGFLSAQLGFWLAPYFPTKYLYEVR